MGKIAITAAEASVITAAMGVSRADNDTAIKVVDEIRAEGAICIDVFIVALAFMAPWATALIGIATNMLLIADVKLAAARINLAGAFADPVADVVDDASGDTRIGIDSTSEVAEMLAAVGVIVAGTLKAHVALHVD